MQFLLYIFLQLIGHLECGAPGCLLFPRLSFSDLWLGLSKTLTVSFFKPVLFMAVSISLCLHAQACKWEKKMLICILSSPTSIYFVKRHKDFGKKNYLEEFCYYADVWQPPLGFYILIDTEPHLFLCSSKEIILSFHVLISLISTIFFFSSRSVPLKKTITTPTVYRVEQSRRRNEVCVPVGVILKCPLITREVHASLSGRRTLAQSALLETTCSEQWYHPDTFIVPVLRRRLSVDFSKRKFIFSGTFALLSVRAMPRCDNQ